MTRNVRSRTGRGLSTAFTGEIVALVVCAFYLLTQSTRLLVLGFAIAGLVGFASVVSMWRGMDEFGPEHRRNARRGTYTFLLTSLLFVLAFLSFQTFPATNTGFDLTGGNETTSPTTPHRFRDLLPATFLLGAAIAAETISGAYFLFVLVGEAWRRWATMYAASGVAIGTFLFLIGLRLVQLFRNENGDGVQSQAGADYYFERYLGILLLAFAIAFALTRIAAAFLLRHAQRKVAEAEAEAPSETAPQP